MGLAFLRRATIGLLRIALVLSAVSGFAAWSIPADNGTQELLVPAKQLPLPAPDTVQVSSVAPDSDIETRLRRILLATGWFEQPGVRADDGVVFLTGEANSALHKSWAGELANNTQDVVAVVNNIQVRTPSPWDLSGTWRDIHDTAMRALRATPLIAIGIFLLFLTWFVSSASVHGTRYLLEKRVKSLLLRQVVSRAVAIPIFIFGLYLVLQLSGLTNLALTLLGGTGLVGLIIGFAFRDIAENFLASILISSQRPFAIGDLIEVASYKGFVQSVNTRSTLLMTLEGNHVQIPNSAVYKGTIINYTANPTMRANFSVGIGYDDSITEAQATALQVLKDHPAVVNDPEPLVLVDSLGAATVNLEVFFWIDVSRYSQIRVLSAIIRLTKHAFEQAGISMPDTEREVVFPRGVPISNGDLLTTAHRKSPSRGPTPARANLDENRSNVNESEGDLETELKEISMQAAGSRIPEGGTDNLLSDPESGG